MRAIVVSLMLLCFLNGPIAYGQVYPEKNLSKEELSRPEVASLVERLRSLRRNLELYGPKHPAYSNVKKQIVSLESQLAELTAKGGRIVEDPAVVNPANDAGLSKMGTLERGEIDQKPEKVSSDWGFDTEARWPLSVQELIGYGKQFSRFPQAYPWLGLRDMIAVGPMPGMGLMWGIQYDPGIDRSYIFQWFDDPGSPRRVLFYESPGLLESLYFPRDFDTTGCFWILRGHPDSAKEAGANSDPSDHRIDVLSVRSERLPPYRVEAGTEELLFQLRKKTPGQLRVFSSQQKGWFFGEGAELFAGVRFPEGIAGEFIDVAKDILELEDRATRSQKIGLSQFIDLHEGRLKDWLTSGVISDLRSYRGVLGMGVDTTGSPLVVDSNGRIRKIQGSIDSEDTKNWPPSRLSELGWYASLKDGLLKDSFKVYDQDHSSSLNLSPDLSKRCRVVGQEIDLDCLRFDHWYCVPGQSNKKVQEYSKKQFPDGALFVETISYVIGGIESVGDDRSRRLETRVLVCIDQEWYAYSYLWNEEQDDGILVQEEQRIDVFREDPSLSRQFRIAPANYCFECHVQGPIGFDVNQLFDSLPKNEVDVLDLELLWGANRLGDRFQVSRSDLNPILIEIEPSKSSEASELVDWEWFEKSLLTEVIDPWYRASFRPSGFFCTELDEKWIPAPKASATLVSQTRQIYTMAQGYIVSKDPKYLEATNKGVGFLLDKFKDINFGGFYYQVSESGEVLDAGKDGYGHAFVIYALATAAKASGNSKYADEALRCWSMLRSKMMEPSGGLMWRAARDFTGLNRRSQNPNMHLFEGLLELYDVTKDEGVYADAKQLLDFVTVRLRHPSGVIPEDYQSNWLTPSLSDQSPGIVMGHQVEWAFLISRAVELGFPPRYLVVGRELMNYSMDNGYDRESGGLREGPGRGKGAWQQAEFLRALLRYYSMHGCNDYLEPIKKTQELIKKDFIDHEYGGWVEWGKKEKGNHWKAASHEVGMYVEGLRIAKLLKMLGQGLEN